ncbi:MAG: hypothetical protein FD183_1429 [Chitinophagaceae bacterium]|nr:MAG: hypothetical protein FD183_1429 [Chitinophagaceae bacterium]
MNFILKTGASKKAIHIIEKKLFKKSRHKGFNAHKYNGVLNLNIDPLEIQKSLRDEWERHSS